jgi:hypothetical protein
VYQFVYSSGSALSISMAGAHVFQTGVATCAQNFTNAAGPEGRFNPG